MAKAKEAAKKAPAPKAVAKATPIAKKEDKKAENKKKKVSDYKVVKGLKKTDHLVLNNRSVMSMWRCLLGGAEGFARGWIYELYSMDEGVGKTSTAVMIAAAAQKQGEKYGHADVENSTMRQYYERQLKVNADEMIFHEKPFRFGEEAFDYTVDIIRNHGVNVAVFDSIAAARPFEQIVEGKDQPGSHARMVSKKLPEVVNAAAEHKAIVFLINQGRINIGVMFGDNGTETGGKAMKFYPSVRIKVWKKAVIKGDNKEELGFIVAYQPTKNRSGYKRGAFEIVMNRGFLPKLAETAVHWAKTYDAVGLIDEKKKTIAGVTYGGKGTDADMAKALVGKEFLVFDAINDWFSAQELGSDVDFATDEGDDDDVNEPAPEVEEVTTDMLQDNGEA